jgi:hypothetical protein
VPLEGRCQVEAGEPFATLRTDRLFDNRPGRGDEDVTD